jgi:hypothetical protein
MSVADTDNQSVTTSKRVVYDLDAIGNVAVPSLGLTLTRMSTAIGPALQQMANFGAALDAFVKPIREMLAGFREFIRTTIQPILDGLNSFIKPLSFLVSLKPVYYVPPQAVPSEQVSSRHLSVVNDGYGYFVIGGKRLKILHPDSSRCGKMLAALLQRRSQLVSYEELQEVIGAGDVRRDLKDLRRQLKKEGYSFEYQLVRTKGIALIGLSSLQ